MTVTSASMPSCSSAKSLPVRPNPVWISSKMRTTSCFSQMVLTFFRYPSGGTMMPASPWIGSIIIATVFGVIASSNALALPKGIILKPFVNGPNPSRYWSSLLNPIIAMVLPWKLFSQTMISAWSFGTPFIWYPHFRTALMTVSTASAPLFIGSTLCERVNTQSSL